MSAFSSCVLRPLEWAGLLSEARKERKGKHVHNVFKTPMWRSALKPDTDGMVQPVPVQQVLCDFGQNPPVEITFMPQYGSPDLPFRLAAALQNGQRQLNGVL
jgi:hypothetical protein